LKQFNGNAPGLCRWPRKDGFLLLPVNDENTIFKCKGPILLFLHGTASSSKGSFGKLWEDQNVQGKEARKILEEKYADRIYAFEHRSLTESPIQNALELARLLQVEAELHLVSHSRGGLVGDLLCHAERVALNDPLKGDLEELFRADRTISGQLGLKPLDPESAKK
jgi:hypothetical protein